MCDSTVLTVWWFPGDAEAQRTARQLPSATGRGGVDDAALVSWPLNQDRPVAWQARDLSGGPRMSGAFWGLLFAHLFLLPISLRKPPALVADDLDDVLSRLGISATFLRIVREHVVPGTSALFVLASTGSVADAAAGRLPQLAATSRGQLVLSAQEAERWHAGFDE